MKVNVSEFVSRCSRLSKPRREWWEQVAEVQVTTWAPEGTESYTPVGSAQTELNRKTPGLCPLRAGWCGGHTHQVSDALGVEETGGVLPLGSKRGRPSSQHPDAQAQGF